MCFGGGTEPDLSELENIDSGGSSLGFAEELADLDIPVDANGDAPAPPGSGDPAVREHHRQTPAVADATNAAGVLRVSDVAALRPCGAHRSRRWTR